MNVTGAFISMLNLAEVYHKKNKVVFILPQKSVLTDSLEEKGYEVRKFDFIQISKSPLKLLLYFPFLLLDVIRLSKLVSKGDLLISNDLYNIAPALVTKLKKKVNLITHVRLLPFAFPQVLYNIWAKIAVNNSSTVVCNSEVTYTNFPVKSKNVLWVYDPVFLNHEEQNIKELNDRITFLFPHNYTTGKGHDFAILFLKKLVALSDNKDVQLRFIGNTLNNEANESYLADLKNQVAVHKLEEHVTFLDFESDLSNEFKNCDVVLNFSKIESLSRVCLEGMMYKRLVVSSKSYGPEELLADGRGILVENDPKSSAVQLIQFLEDTGLYANTIAKAHNYVMDSFSYSNTIQPMTELVDSLLSETVDTVNNK